MSAPLKQRLLASPLAGKLALWASWLSTSAAVMICMGCQAKAGLAGHLINAVLDSHERLEVPQLTRSLPHMRRFFWTRMQLAENSSTVTCYCEDCMSSCHYQEHARSCPSYALCAKQPHFPADRIFSLSDSEGPSRLATDVLLLQTSRMLGEAMLQQTSFILSWSLTLG